MKINRAVFFCVAVATAMQIQAGQTARPLVLVERGRAAITVVVANPLDDKTPARKNTARRKPGVGIDEALAVNTLVDWIGKITDVELSVANQVAQGAPAIYVGRAAIEAGLKLDDIASESHEGIRIVVDGQRVLIAGQSEAATLKAVCRFLEELGCRYLMDGPLGEVFPRSRTLAVRELSITEKPGLRWRNPKGPSWNGRLWKAWNGAGGEPFGHAHSWGNYVSPALFDEHPEYFAVGADGQRKAGGWICTSNPGLREHFSKGVIAAIENGTRNPSLSPTDGRGYCQCTECLAQDDPQSREPSSGTVSVSNRYVDFFDAIGRKVALTHPESVLSFYCYADYTQPPTVRRQLSPNLCAMIAPFRYCRLHPLGHPGCTSREQQVAMIDGWSGVASRIGYYNYMYNLFDGTLPSFKFTACQTEIPYLADRGLSYMTIEILSNWHIYGPQIYLSLRLAYDPHADATAIMEDYWLKFYGPDAAPHMRAYWMGLDAAQQQLDTHAGGFYGLSQMYTHEFLTHCESLVARAAEAAKGDAVYAQRVALHREGLRSARAYRTICDAMNRGDFATALAEYEQTVERLNGVIASGGANHEYGTAYLERYLSKTIRAGAAATRPPNRVLQVLPDRWRFSFDEDDTGNTQGFHRADFRDEAWPMVATHNTTLDAQGYDKNTILWYRSQFVIADKREKLAIFFGEVDGASEVYVNGRKITVPQQFQAAARKGVNVSSRRVGQAKPRLPFELDITSAAQAGKNVIAVRVDHSTMTELALGGIVRPVVLISKPK